MRLCRKGFLRVAVATMLGSIVLLGACSSDPDVKTQANTTVEGNEDGGTDTTEAPVTTAPPAAVGSTISLEGSADGSKVDVTVLKVVDNAKGRQFFTPHNGKYIAVQLRLANTGTATYSDSPGNGAKLIDQEDQQYTSGLAETTAGPDFGGTVDLPPGGNRVGFIVFDVPATTVATLFQFSLDSGFADDKGQWQLS